MSAERNDFQESAADVFRTARVEHNQHPTLVEAVEMIREHGVDISAAHLNRIERGLADPDMNVVHGFSLAFNLHPTAFFPPFDMSLGVVGEQRCRCGESPATSPIVP